MRPSIGALCAVTAVLAATAVVSMPSAHATARGHNGLIAFAHKGQIFTVDSKGHHPTQLTHSKRRSPASQPKWAPDGKHIAYVQVGAFGAPFIWEMTANGTHRHRLWKGTDPAWAPNGKRLAYVKEVTTPPTDPNPGCVYDEILTRPVAGGDARLINSGQTSCTSKDITIVYGPNLAWSQNQKLVYVGIDDVLSNGSGGSSFTVVEAVIGAHTAGTDLGSNNTTDTVVLSRSEADMEDQTTVPMPPTVDAAPVKDRLVYSDSYPTVEVKAGRLREETANEKFINLISGAKFTSFPVYSPDGKKVLYVQHKPGHHAVIKRLNLHSGHSKVVVRGTQPDWQPRP